MACNARVGIGAPGAPKTGKGRWHFVVDQPAVEWSVLFLREEAGDETRLLVERGESRLELVSRQGPSEQDSTESVTDVVTKETLSRRLLLSGYQSIDGCKELRGPDACVLFSNGKANVKTSLSALGSPEGDAVRARVRSLASEPFQAKLLSLADLLPVSMDFDAYGPDFLGLVFPDRFAKSTVKSFSGKRTPGCDFDARFGHPCSEPEKTREKKRFEARPK